MDVLIVLSQLSLGAWGVDGSIGERLALLQTRRHLDAMHGARFLVLFPGRTSDVPTNNGFNRKNTQLAHLHAAVLELGTKRLGDLRGKVESDKMGAQRRNSLCQDLKPGLCAKREQDSLVRNSLQIAIS